MTGKELNLSSKTNENGDQEIIIGSLNLSTLNLKLPLSHNFQTKLDETNKSLKDAQNELKIFNGKIEEIDERITKIENATNKMIIFMNKFSDIYNIFQDNKKINQNE